MKNLFALYVSSVILGGTAPSPANTDNRPEVAV